MKVFFNSLINGIKEKTNIDLSVYSNRGEYLFGKDKSQTGIAEVDKIISDKKNNRTLFPIKFRAENYVCVINGCTEAEKNYAGLIPEYAKNLMGNGGDLTREEFLRALIFNELDITSLTKYRKKFNLKESPCFVMIIKANRWDIKDALDILLDYGDAKKDTLIEIDKSTYAVIKFIDAFSAEYRSPKEYAYYLTQSVLEESGVNISIYMGESVDNISEINKSYNQALETLKIGETLGLEDSVHTYKEFLYIKALKDIPEYKLKEYLYILTSGASQEIFNDSDMIESANALFDNDLNVSETARKTFIHRNTLIYRLDKIERATGLNIRKFSDAIAFKYITLLSKLVK